MSDPTPRTGDVHGVLDDAELVELASGDPRPAGGSTSTIATRYGRRDYTLRRILVLADMTAILTAATIALAQSSVRTGLDDLVWVATTLPVWVLIFRAYGLYERDVKRIHHDALDDIPPLFHAMVIGTLGLWAFFRFFAESNPLILSEVVVFAASAPLLIYVCRWLGRRGVLRAMGPERVVFLGEVPILPTFLRKVESHPEYGLEPVGIVPRENARTITQLPVLAHLETFNMTDLVKRHAIERIIVAHSEVDDAMLLSLLQECGFLSIKVSILPRYIDALGPSVEIDEVEGMTILDLNPLVLSRSSRFFKRLMDLVGATVGLILVAPLMALIAIAIKFDSRGPVLFKQERIGRRGRIFKLYKFRTMVVDADDQHEDLIKISQDPHWLKLDDDPRVTRLGRVLRRLSLDELPQLVNVLKSEMSLVGPRPLLAYQDARVTGWARARLDLAPGITGLWQVLGRTNIPFEEMVKLDTLYVTNWSLWLDLKLVLRTFRIVVSRHGAN